MTEEQLFESLQHCVKCGSCKVLCPTYKFQRNEAASARGRVVILHAVLSGSVEPSRSALDKILGCIQCGACARSCPSGLNIPEIVYRGRKYLNGLYSPDRALRFAAGFILKYPDEVFRITRLLGRPLASLLENKMLLPDHFRIPAKLPDQPVYKATGTSKGRVAVFAGCSTRYLFPHLGEALVRVLSNLGYEVILPREEQCCGVPFRTLGMEDKAVDYARRNLAVFSRLKADAVVSLCPTCIVALKKMYPELIGEGTDNIMDVASFLLRHEGRAFSKRLLMKGFYHDPCHMIYGLNITEEPRKILRECGIELVEGDQNSCCGFGGSYSIKFRNESIKFARARAEEIESSEAEAVFTSCPGCLLQLKKVVKKAGVFHIIEAIDSAV